MLPTSVEPRAKSRMMSRQGPFVNSSCVACRLCKSLGAAKVKVARVSSEANDFIVNGWLWLRVVYGED